MIEGARRRRPPLSPLRLQNAAEQIAERLVTAIALGEFVPGQRLPAERELAGMLEVSRSTVREALQRLVATGYVKIHRGRNGGAVVQADWGPGTAEMVERTLAPNWEYFELLFDLRRLIEQQIARTAAERLEDEHVADIEAARDRYRDAGSDREASRVADRELHAAIARATKNPLLGNLSRQLRAQISLGFEAEPYSAEIRERAIEQHTELVRAVVERRPEDAAALAAEHFSLTEDAIRKLLGRVRPVSPRMRYILERILLDDPDAARHERVRLPAHPARPRRPGADDARLPGNAAERRHDPPSAPPRRAAHHPVPASGSRASCTATSAATT